MDCHPPLKQMSRWDCKHAHCGCTDCLIEPSDVWNTHHRSKRRKPAGCCKRLRIRKWWLSRGECRLPAWVSERLCCSARTAWGRSWGVECGWAKKKKKEACSVVNIKPPRTSSASTVWMQGPAERTLVSRANFLDPFCHHGKGNYSINYRVALIKTPATHTMQTMKVFVVILYFLLPNVRQPQYVRWYWTLTSEKWTG